MSKPDSPRDSPLNTDGDPNPTTSREIRPKRNFSGRPGKGESLNFTVRAWRPNPEHKVAGGQGASN
jgi:hypothetical protein